MLRSSNLYIDDDVNMRNKRLINVPNATTNKEPLTFGQFKEAQPLFVSSKNLAITANRTLRLLELPIIANEQVQYYKYIEFEVHGKTTAVNVQGLQTIRLTARINKPNTEVVHSFNGVLYKTYCGQIGQLIGTGPSVGYSDQNLNVAEVRKNSELYNCSSDIKGDFSYRFSGEIAYKALADIRDIKLEILLASAGNPLEAVYNYIRLW